MTYLIVVIFLIVFIFTIVSIYLYSSSDNDCNDYLDDISYTDDYNYNYTDDDISYSNNLKNNYNISIQNSHRINPVNTNPVKKQKNTFNTKTDFIKPTPYEIGYIENSPQTNANLLGGERYPIKQPYVNYSEKNMCFDCGK